MPVSEVGQRPAGMQVHMSSGRYPLQLISPASGEPRPAVTVPGAVILRGELEAIPAVDVLQLVCAQAQSCIVTFSNLGQTATVSAAGGELVDAQWGETSGQDALVEIISARGGQFEVTLADPPAHRTLYGRWQQCVLNAVHAIDERANSRSRSDAPPNRSAMPSPARSKRKESGEYRFGDMPTTSDDSARTLARLPSPANNTAETARALELIDLGFLALRAGNVDEARAHWSSALALDPTNRALQFNLRKLEAQGRHRD